MLTFEDVAKSVGIMGFKSNNGVFVKLFKPAKHRWQHPDPQVIGTFDFLEEYGHRQTLMECLDVQNPGKVVLAYFSDPLMGQATVNEVYTNERVRDKVLAAANITYKTASEREEVRQAIMEYLNECNAKLQERVRFSEVSDYLRLAKVTVNNVDKGQPIFKPNPSYEKGHKHEIYIFASRRFKKDNVLDKGICVKVTKNGPMGPVLVTPCLYKLHPVTKKIRTSRGLSSGVREIYTKTMDDVIALLEFYQAEYMKSPGACKPFAEDDA